MFDNANVNPCTKKGFLTSIPCIPILAYGQSNAECTLNFHLGIIYDQAFGLHAHEEEGSGGDSHADHSEGSAFVWKAVAVLASIYVFFLFETLMHLGLKSKFGDEHGHSHVNVEVC